MGVRKRERYKQSRYFYRNALRRVALGLSILVGIDILILVAVGYLATHQGEPDYYATSSVGGIVPLKASQHKIVGPQ